MKLIISRWWLIFLVMECEVNSHIGTFRELILSNLLNTRMTLCWLDTVLRSWTIKKWGKKTQLCSVCLNLTSSEEIEPVLWLVQQEEQSLLDLEVLNYRYLKIFLLSCFLVCWCKSALILLILLTKMFHFTLIKCFKY